MRQIIMIMTVEEVSKRYGYSANSIQKNFPRTAASIEKRFGVTLVKCKKDGKTYYQISDNRAATIYDETRDIINIGQQTLSLENYQFFAFLGIAMTPQCIFRGTRQDFLNYIGIPANEKNLSMLNVVLKQLADKEYIMFDIDEDYIIVYIKRRVEKEMQVGIEMVKHCRKLAEKYHKNGDKIAQFIKVWLALQICAENQPFKYDDIVKLTGLSKYQIHDIKEILSKDEIFKFTRAGSYWQCNGMNVDENAYLPN